MAARRWFRVYRPAPAARVRLICLPHAGGAASFYRSWPGCFPPSVEVVAVQPPGREDRLDDAFCEGMAGLVENLSDAMSVLCDRPYVLFGHSMGAAVAFELCVALRRRGRRLPLHLVVSGREAPCRHRGGTVHLGDDASLCAELRRLNGTVSALMDNADWRSLVLPAIRSDYHAIETYRPSSGSPLPVPITALAGDSDHELLPGDVEAWRAWTAASFDLRRFSGGHFYLNEQRAAVTHVLGRLLDVPPSLP